MNRLVQLELWANHKGKYLEEIQKIHVPHKTHSLSAGGYTRTVERQASIRTGHLMGMREVFDKIRPLIETLEWVAQETGTPYGDRAAAALKLFDESIGGHYDASRP